jgi:hypothetical protein
LHRVSVLHRNKIKVFFTDSMFRLLFFIIFVIVK